MPILTIWIDGGNDANDDELEKVLACVEDYGIPRESVRVMDGGEQLRMSDGVSSWIGIRGDFIYLASKRSREAGKENE